MPEQTYTYDVFISYSHKDEDWVCNTLLARLEEAGLQVCIDYRDFKPGKPALLNMQDSVKSSRRTLLVLTGNWVASEWTLFESLLTSTKDPAGLRQKTIPILLEKCELPEFISMLTWVDFTRADREKLAWTQLLNACDKSPEEAKALAETFEEKAPEQSAYPEAGFGQPELSLAQVLPGNWITFVNTPTPWGPMVGQIQIALWPNGVYQLQKNTPPLFTGQGQWILMTPTDIELRGSISNGFQVSPYWVHILFNQITPTLLNGYTNAWEQVSWQKIG